MKYSNWGSFLGGTSYHMNLEVGFMKVYLYSTNRRMVHVKGTSGAIQKFKCNKSDLNNVEILRIYKLSKFYTIWLGMIKDATYEGF